MNRTVTVRVEGRPPGANDLIRMGHWKVGKVRRDWKDRTHQAAVRAMTSGPFAHAWMVTAVGRSGRSPESTSYQEPFDWWPLQHAHVAITWRCKTRRRRDFDNLVSGLKPLLDGLVSSGVLEDDSTDVLMRLGPFLVEVGAEVDETILEVSECDSDGMIRYRAWTQWEDGTAGWWPPREERHG